MKRLVALILIFALSFQFFIRIGAVGYYLLNREYIAKVLCINKDAPELECDGKCYLKNKLKQTEEQAPQTASSPIPVKYEPVEFIAGLFSSQVQVTLTSSQVYSNPGSAACCEGNPGSVFHPPCDL